MSQPTQYFKSLKDQYVFALLHTDGQNRTTLLNITEELYENSRLADLWYQFIKTAILPASNNDELRALDILTRLFNTMMDVHDEN